MPADRSRKDEPRCPGLDPTARVRRAVLHVRSRDLRSRVTRSESARSRTAVKTSADLRPRMRVAVSTRSKRSRGLLPRDLLAPVQSLAPGAQGSVAMGHGRVATLRSGVRDVQGARNLAAAQVSAWRAVPIRSGWVDFRVSPGRSAEQTTRSKPPGDADASSAAHTALFFKRKCCIG